MLVHGGGQKGSGVLTKLRKLGSVTEVKSGELRASEFPGFVAAEVAPPRRRASTRTRPGFLVQAVGQDLRSLAAAADQLTNDFPGEPLTAEKVKQYFGGRAEAKSFAVADAAFCGRREAGARGAALGARRRHAAGAGDLRVRRAVPAAWPATWPRPAAMREDDLAREVGVPPWKLRTIRDQSRGWSDAGIARAIRAVAQADADIKGAASDASYTLERLVLTVTALRDPALRQQRLTRQKVSTGQREAGGRQREAAFLAMADLRFAAWFLWMTPLEAALSSFLAASRPASTAASLSPASAASRNLRTADFRPVLTALLRSCRISFCLLRLIWDLMFATTAPSS